MSSSFVVLLGMNEMTATFAADMDGTTKEGVKGGLGERRERDRRTEREK